MRQFGWVSIAVSVFDESLHRSYNGIVTPDPMEGVQEHTFSVCARTIKEEENMFGVETREAVTSNALQIALEVVISGCYSRQKCVPKRRWDVFRTTRSDFRAVIRSARRIGS